MINRNTELRCCSGHLILAWSIHDLRFESSVISYGSEALPVCMEFRDKFESSVISHDSEALLLLIICFMRFESNILSYGSDALDLIVKMAV